MYTAIKDHSAYSDTRSKQEAIRTALIGYLRNNRRLPPADTNLPPDGTMDAGGWGVLPYRDLGLPRDAVLDGWGNYFSYRVSNTGASTNWTLTTGFNLASYTAPPIAITVNDAVGQLTDRAVVVIISHGKNSFGAATTRGTSRITPTAGVATEDTNAVNGTTYNQLDPNPQAGYDDVVTYMTPADLWKPLIDDGTLKGQCQAYCVPAVTATCTAGGGICTCTAEGVVGTLVAPCTACGTCAKTNTGTNCNATNIPIGVTPIATCP